jgi:hypothetical protein
LDVDEDETPTVRHPRWNAEETPTVRHLRWNAEETPTIPRLRWDEARTRPALEMPTWPVARPPVRASSTPADGHPIALGISLVANGVLLASLLLLLLFARAGAFLPPSSAAQSVLPASALTATPTSTPSLSGWLQVAPTSVYVGCSGTQQTQYVVLTNTGSEDLHWQVGLGVPLDPAGLQVTPPQGDLPAGTSVALQIQNQSQSAGHRGVITFDPGTPAAGMPPSLIYTTFGCDG